MGNITTEQLEELALRADKRLDNLELGVPRRRDMTILASGWTADSGDANYPYKYTLTVDGVTTASRADVVFDSASVSVASECGVCAVSETAAGTVVLRSRTAPTADLTGLLYITKTAL